MIIAFNEYDEKLIGFLEGKPIEVTKHCPLDKDDPYWDAFKVHIAEGAGDSEKANITIPNPCEKSESD